MNDSQSSEYRHFTKVRRNPGIFKVALWNPEKRKYIDPRDMPGSNAKPYRALRRVKILGENVQQCAHFDSIEEARLWRAEKVPQADVRRRVTYTLKNLIDEWMEWSKPPRTALSNWQTNGVKVKHLAPLYRVEVEELSALDIDRWLAKVMAPSYPKLNGRMSFEKEIKALTTMLNWYREYKNPRYQPPILKRHRRDCVLVEKPRHLDRSLKEEDLERFLERLKSRHRPVYYPLAAFQALTGARIGEACGLKWECVDFARGIVEIRRVCIWDHHTRAAQIREGTKTGETRSVLLPPRLITILKPWKEGNEEGPYVFHLKGELLHYPAIQNAYKKAYAALGLPVRSTHVLRHTFGTLHANQTKDIRATQAALGHRDLRITQQYAHVALETQQKALADFTLGQIQKKNNFRKRSRESNLEERIAVK